MTMQPGQVVGALKLLYETCKDGENSYRNAAAHAKQEELRVSFYTFADQRALFAADLRAELERRGGHDEKSASVSGALSQSWAEIKIAFSGGGDKALLAQCEQSEGTAEDRFEETLKQELPTDVQALVRRQVAAVRAAQDRMRELRLVVN